MSKPVLNPKPPPDDARRREHQRAVKQALIELPAFALTLLAASVRTAPGDGYQNYALPQAPAELAFTLKGALRLEMMNAPAEAYKKYRRLFGSNTKAHDLKAWRSRVYVAAYADGATAARAAQRMLLPTTQGGDEFGQAVSGAPGPLVLLQINDVYLDLPRSQLWSDLLAEFIRRESRLLTLVSRITVLPPGKEATP
jgi:hypothetical protein